MAADYASWSEENYEGADWEIVMREKPFTGPIHNISNTDARSMYSQTNYWQRDEDPRFLYIAWTEGDGNRFAREVRALEYPLNHPPVPHYYVETGQEEPSFYCLERDSFLQFGPEPYQQVDIHADQLIYRLPGLMPWLRYRLVVTGYWEGEDEVREQLDIDGLDQRLMRLTPGVPETLAVWISPAAYKEDRSVDVNLTLVTGEWAVTGPMVLYEFERDEDGGDGGAQSAPATRCEPEPEAFTLSQSYPNPLHSHATIGFHISASTSLSLKIYDTSGRLVRTLVDNPVPAGHHKVTWDTTDDAGMAVGNGVYFYRLSATPQGGSASGGEAGNLVRANKMVVLR